MFHTRQETGIPKSSPPTHPERLRDHTFVEPQYPQALLLKPTNDVRTHVTCETLRQDKPGCSDFTVRARSCVPEDKKSLPDQLLNIP